MKKLLNFLLLLLLPCMLHAQGTENTLAGSARIKGGFGGPFFVYGQIENHHGGGAGGGGAFIINDFFLGGYGQGETFGQHVVNGLNYDLGLSQGGLWIGYVWPSRRMVHGFGSFKAGYGAATLERNPRNGEPDSGGDIEDNVWVISPEIGVEVNIAHWMRAAITGGYRWVNGVSKLPYFTDDDYKSPVLGLTLRFGNFGYAKKE